MNGTNDRPILHIHDKEGLLAYDVLLQNYLHSPNATRIVDHQYRVLSQNPAMDRLAQVPPSEVKGKKCYQLMRTPEYCNTPNCPLRAIISGQQQVISHCERELWNGKRFPALVMAAPFHDKHGNLVGMIEITMDESDAVAITRALEEKNRALRQTHQLLKAYNEAAYAFNKETRMEPLASEALRLLVKHTPAVLGVIYRYDQTESRLMPLSSYAIDKEPQAFSVGQGIPGQILRDKQPVFLDQLPEDYFNFSSGTGGKRPGYLALLPIEAGGKILGVVELGAFSSLGSHKVFLQNVVRQLGIAMHNALALKKAEELARELQEKNRALAAQNEELQAQSEELIAQSEEIQAQAEELAAQRDALEQKTLEAEEASRLKSVFLSNMSHELRTPLNAILGLTSLMKDGATGPLNDKQRQYLSVVLRNANHLLELINDILDLSRIETGRDVVKFDKILLKGFIESLANSIRPLAERKELEFVLEIDPRLESVVSDERKLRQILTNLLSNAIKFTEKGRITLSATLHEGDEHDHVYFKVKDTGIGIPPGYEEVIFEPFRQVNGSTTRRYGGTGLGLNICKKLCEILGGQIGVQSRPGEGSEFTVIIPTDRRSKKRPSDKEWEQLFIQGFLPESTEEHDTKKKPHAPQSDLKDRHGRHILIIDDDLIAIRELGVHLKQAGFKVSFAFDGEAGLRMLQKDPPDLVLLEIKMPMMDGFELLNEMRQDARLDRIPVLVLTSLDLDDQIKANNLPSNVHGVLRKGNLSREELMSRIQAILGNRRQAPEVSEKRPKGTKQKERRPRGVPRPGGYKILIAEDNEDNLFLLEEILRPEGYEVLKARDGWEAIDVAKQYRPDLILMDIHMPHLGGVEAAQAIREIPEIQDVPIVALTAKAMKGDRDHILSSGLDDYISKPVEPQVLKKVLSRWLSSKEKENG